MIKTTDDRKRRILQIKNMAVASAGSKERDIECWNMYNEFQDDKEFDYLRKVGKFELPAKVRNIGKQRSKINLLVSQKSRRPFNYSLMVSNKASVKQKYTDRLIGWLNAVYEKVSQKASAYDQVLVNIEQQSQQIDELIQNAGQQNQGQQQQVSPEQLDTLKKMKPQMDIQIARVKRQIKQQQALTETEMQEIEQKYLLNYKDAKEILAKGGLEKLREILETDDKSIKNFISQCVTGKQYYYVDYIPGETLPRFENLNTIKVYFPSIESIKWVQSGPWVAIEELWSIDEVKRMYGDRFPSEVADVEMMLPSINSEVVVTPDMGAIMQDGVYSGTTEMDKVVRVFRIWYKEEREIKTKYSPNPHNPGKEFTHFVDPNKKVIYADKYLYRNGKYINKKDKNDVLSPSDIEMINTAKGERAKSYYIRDRYQAVVLNDTVVLDLGKDPIQPRKVDSLYDVVLPIVGRSFSTITERPYSLMWSTKDLQKLYKIISYHRELLLAISGARGNIIDISQKPKDMSRQEWEYHKKMGRLYVQTVDKNGRKVNSSFNQWQSFDDSVSPAIQYLNNMLESVDNDISETMGISRPRLGQVISTDQVGTTQQSLEQSQLTTEILYYDHDVVEAKALSMLINLAVKYCWDEDEILDIFSDKLGSEMVKIPKGTFSDTDFDIYLFNNGKDERDMRDLRQLIIQQNNKGQLPFSNVLSMWNINSLVELQKKFEYFDQKAQEIAQMNAQSQQQNSIELEQAKIKFQKEYDMLMAEQVNQLKARELELKQAELQMQAKKNQDDTDLGQMKIETERDIKLADMQSNNAIEFAYLKNQDKHNTIEEQLQSIQMQLDHIINSEQLNVTQDKVNKDHIHNMEKVKVDNYKIHHQNKNNISDL